MSQTTSIGYEQRWFWAYDEARAIWLKYMIEAVERRVSAEAPTELAASTAGWGVTATVGDFALDLGPWTPSQRAEFLDVNDEACAALESAKPLALDEVRTWHLDDRPLVQRVAQWEDPLDIDRITDLAHAVADLIQDRLEDPPVGTNWLYGGRGGRQTIATRS